MPFETKLQPIHLPHILLPKKGVDLSKWACVACDQFTSNPEYWEELKAYVDHDPSTYHMILPEVYLETMGHDMIDKINQTMHHYLDGGILEDIGPSMMLIERMPHINQKRLGLMFAIDLEAYDYHEGTKPLIRTTEKTIIERIPPRVKIRKNAPLELTHVMLLMDDKKIKIIEKLYEKRNQFKKRYDFVLNMLGGHIRGYQIPYDEKIIADFMSLIDDKDNPVLFVVGDGNHSLATAKAHWENIKQSLNDENIECHPARFAMVEVVNIYDPGLSFEGIHRVMFNAGPDFLIDLFHQVDKEEETWVYTRDIGKQSFYIPKSTANAYEQIQQYIDTYIERHKDTRVDYIHGDEELVKICDAHPGAIGIRMPALLKKDLFPFIKEQKVLPRKSFSMGSATAKRYYLESRIITKEGNKNEKSL